MMRRRALLILSIKKYILFASRAKSLRPRDHPTLGASSSTLRPSNENYYFYVFGGADIKSEVTLV